FVMIDRLVKCVPHETITTMKIVSIGDAVGAAATEGAGIPEHGAAPALAVRIGPRAGAPEPTFPSAMVLEGMGQSASLLYQLSYGRMAPADVPLLGWLKATFHAHARPGDAVTYEVRAVKMTPTMGLFEARASVGAASIAEA